MSIRKPGKLENAPAGPANPSLQYCSRDGYRLVLQGLAAIVRVAQSAELRYALEAGQWLVVYGEELMQQQRQESKPKTLAGKVPTRAEILADLRGLYAQALGSAPLVVEATAEAREGAAHPVQGNGRSGSGDPA